MENNCSAQPTKLQVTFQIAGALLGGFALITQLYLAVLIGPKLGLTYAGGFVRFFSFMTIWTNILVTLHFITALVAPNSRLGLFLQKPIIQTGTLVYILIVALVYHFVLANLWNPVGMQAVADISLHYLVPFFYLLYYLVFAPKGLQQYKNSFKWLIYPLTYIIFSLVYGAITRLYPYPFIDLQKLGLPMLVRNILLLSVAYYLFGLLVIFIDKKLAKRV
ncbi:MAG: Pr6Pr family membrane protein [Chitinophagaceae bacterium]